MKIIDYYNYIMTAAFVLWGVAAVIDYMRKGRRDRGQDISDKKAYRWLFLITIISAVLRLYRLGAIPYGLQQDEASLGYDAFCLATKGIDRNGFAYPVYPITWGCGGGSPLMIYLNVISIKLFGTGVVKLRMLPALLGIATVFLFFFALKKAFNNRLAVIGTAILAICPWHVILSRWSLDSNIMPFVMLVPMLLFVKAVESGKTSTFCLSAALYGLCMYSYGSANIVIPLHLLMICIYCLINRNIEWKQLILSGVCFTIVCLPLGIFYAVNYFGLPEIITDVVSFNRFTASRTGEVFISTEAPIIPQLMANLKVLVKVMTVGDETDMVCHYIPGYSTLFKFTFPVSFLGIIMGISDLGKKKSRKEDVSNALWLSMLAACIVLGIVVQTDISRMVMIFMPLIFFFVKGLDYIACYLRRSEYYLTAAVLVAGVMFTRSYFVHFNDLTAFIYMPGYGEAVARAYEVSEGERQVYSTYEGLSAPFALALYYTDYDPELFYTSVVYKDPNDEFRIARSFGNFVFDDLPANISDSAYEDTVFVATKGEFEAMNPGDEYIAEDAGNYVVFYK